MKRKKQIAKLYMDSSLDQSNRLKMKYNQSFWEQNAAKFGKANNVSWGDYNMMNLEIGNIVDFIKPGYKVLDIGCSNGYSTFNIAKNAPKAIFKAFDYSPKAIKIAKSLNSINDSNISEFYCGNILDIKEPKSEFDIAYTVRVLINLPSWRLQKEAIKQVHRILKPGGLYLMSEAFKGSLDKINALRLLAGMKKLEMHKFNLYLEEKKVEKFVTKYFKIAEIRKFSSIYYAASRFLRYLTLKSGDRDTFDNDINNLFAKYKTTDNSGDFGIQKLYVLKKKE